MSEHPDFLRTPASVCKPDRRTESFGRLTKDGFHSIQIEDQYGLVSCLELHDGVPEDIRIQFDTSKNLYLYSWFVYRFYPVTLHHAYACLELALRERFEAEMLIAGERKRKYGPGLRRLLKYAVENKFLSNENFKGWQHKTWLNAKMRTMHELSEEMNRLGVNEMGCDESLIEIKDVDRNHDYLTILQETLPELRNHYAHGSKSLHSQVLGTLRIVEEIINQIFPKSGPKSRRPG